MGLVFVLLLAAWALALGPAVLQTVGSSAPEQTERMFQRALRALGRRSKSAIGTRSILVPPKPVYPEGGHAPIGAGPPPRPVSTAAIRRRRNLTYLALFIVVTFVLGLFPALRFLLVLNLVADVLLIAYLGAALYLAVWPPSSERVTRTVPRTGDRPVMEAAPGPESAGPADAPPPPQTG